MMPRNLRNVLDNERGSVVASVAFIVVASILATGMLTGMLTARLISASTTTHRGVVNGVAQTAEAYRGTPTPLPTEPTECTQAPCITVTEVLDADGIRQVTVEGTGLKSSMSVTQSLRPVEGSHISGFDATGNPVWTTTAEGTTTFQGYTHGGAE